MKIWAFNTTFQILAHHPTSTGKFNYGSHLPMSPDHRTKQLPRAATSVNADHSQNLEETETTKRRRRKHLTTGA